MKTQSKVWLLCLAIGVSSSANPQRNAPRASENAMTPESSMGYVPIAQLPSSLQLTPPPPMEGSAAKSRDEEINRQALALHGTPRWDLAARDAVLTFPAVAQTFSCALGVPVSQEQTPRLFVLLRRTLADAARSTTEAKDHYRRQRPFMINGKPICTPSQEAVLRNNGSYPSGHAAIGMAFGLVLTQVALERANALVARGRAFGQSRVVV